MKNNNNYALFLATHKLCEYTVRDCNAIAQTRAAKVSERALCYVLLQYVFHDDTDKHRETHSMKNNISLVAVAG